MLDSARDYSSQDDAANLSPDSTVEQTSLWESLGIQLRVIGALLMREILDRYGRHNLGFLWMFLEPMLFTLAVTTLWSVVGLSHLSDFPIVAFAVTGYSAVLLWRNMPARCVRAVQPNHTLMHHRNIKIIDIYSARLLLEAGGATTSFVILSVVFTSFGLMSLPEDPPEGIPGLDHAGVVWLLTRPVRRRVE